MADDDDDDIGGIRVEAKRFLNGVWYNVSWETQGK